MSFTKYPKNYHANGYGWHNLAAAGYAKPPSPTKSSTSPSNNSPYSMHYSMPQTNQPFVQGMPQMPALPSSNIYQQNTHPSGMQLSYGFAPNIIPSHIPNIVRDDNVDQNDGRPLVGWALGGNKSLTGSTDSGNVHDTIKAQAEIPCQAVIVPDEDMPIYSFFGSRVSVLK